MIFRNRHCNVNTRATVFSLHMNYLHIQGGKGRRMFLKKDYELFWDNYPWLQGCQSEVEQAFAGQILSQKYFLCVRLQWPLYNVVVFAVFCDGFCYWAFMHEKPFFTAFSGSICQSFINTSDSIMFLTSFTFPPFDQDISPKASLTNHPVFRCWYPLVPGWACPGLLIWSYVRGSEWWLGVSVKTLLSTFEQQGRFAGSRSQAKSIWSPLLSSVFSVP